ncbi:uncharacterized protein LOC124271781 [Haliotis rubra]|uniref:uncharacterized protein LOC124271781 n=1 Tax=Haliotis rubra TaxID=36100 RepID=UPI001EE5E144|nr:uncharacterized protein LOC124271781 [Haliotis rubra]
MAAEQYNPVNVQCVPGRKALTFHYNVAGITDVSWDIVQKDREHVAKFRATAGGSKYGHTTNPFPDNIRVQLVNASQKTTRNDFQVTVKSNNHEIRDYFRC